MALSAPTPARPAALAERRQPSLAAPAAPRSRWPGLIPPILLAFVVGIGPFFDAFYRSSIWQPATLAALLALGAAVVLVRRLPSGWALVSLAALTALLAVGALSTTWAESVDRAWLDASRLVLYVAFFGLALCVIRDEIQGLAAIAALAIGAAAVVVVIEIRLFSGAGPEQFSGFRLNEPVGYVNGVAACLLIGVWLFVGLSERFRSWWAQATLMALTAMACCLVVLTQSRAVLPAVVVSVACCLLPPGRLRRAWFLAFATIATALAAPWLLDVFAQEQQTDSALPRADTVRAAAAAALFASVGAAAAWGLVSAFAPRFRRLRRARLAAATGLVALVVTATGFVIALGEPVERAERAADDFLELSDRTVSERFTSGGGYRADLWRIALNQFERKPITGIGLGNYELPFVLEREHLQYVRQPHSLELQLLAELGLVGLAAFLLFAVGVYVVAWQARGGGTLRIAVMVAGLGGFTVWLTHTSVDWLHNLPAVTGIALLAAAALAGLRVRPSPPLPRSRGRLVRLAVVCVLALAAAGVGRHWIADLYRDKGQSELADNPVATLDQASASLQLNPHSLETHYLAAAAYARLGRYDAARATLRDATRLEPSRYVPWLLLGDLAAREGRLAEAKRYYSRAVRLNPLEPTLKELVRDPAIALR